MMTSTAITTLRMLEGTATSLRVIRLTCTQHSAKAEIPEDPGLPRDPLQVPLQVPQHNEREGGPHSDAEGEPRELVED
jgi:hypothetical protein